MMIVKILGVVVVLTVVYYSIIRLPRPPAKISQPVSTRDNQFDVFRDMEPRSQTRVNQMVGFLQEDLGPFRTGPIGDFVGADSDPGNARLYEFS